MNTSHVAMQTVSADQEFVLVVKGGQRGIFPTLLWGKDNILEFSGSWLHLRQTGMIITLTDDISLI